MKLDRNIHTDGRGKYALVKIRDLEDDPGEYSEDTAFGKAVAYRFPAEVIDWGSTPETDFFVIRLKDNFAEPALKAYARAVEDHAAILRKAHDIQSALSWEQYADEIRDLAEQARLNPYRKLPD